MAMFNRKNQPVSYVDRLAAHDDDAMRAIDTFNRAVEQLEAAAEGLDEIAAEAKAEAEQHRRWADHAALNALKHRAAADKIRNLIS